MNLRCLLVGLVLATVVGAGCAVPPIADMEYAWQEYRLATRAPVPPDPELLEAAGLKMNEAQDLVNREEFEAAGPVFREAGQLANAAREHRAPAGWKADADADAAPTAPEPLAEPPADPVSQPEARVQPEAPAQPEVPAAAQVPPAPVGAPEAEELGSLPPGPSPGADEPVRGAATAIGAGSAAGVRTAPEVVPSSRVREEAGDPSDSERVPLGAPARVISDSARPEARGQGNREAALPPVEALESSELAQPVPPPVVAEEVALPVVEEPAPAVEAPVDPDEVARDIAMKEIEVNRGPPPSETPLAELPVADPSAISGPMAGREYVVDSGETLWTIAGKVYGDRSYWELIYKANRDQIPDPSQVYVGQKLMLPRLEADPVATPPPAPAPAAAPPPETRLHVLGSGETLRTVAERYYGDREMWGLVYEANRDRIDDPDRVPAGLRLTIPPRP